MEAFFIIVALIIAFTGLTMLFWGLGQRFLSRQKKKGALRKIITGILLGAATITLINFYWAITSTSLEGISIKDVAIYGAATAALLVISFLLMRSMYLPWSRAHNESLKQEEAAQAEAARKTNVLKFYEECLAAGVQTLENEGKRQKANLIAAKYFKTFDLEEIFAEGKTLHEEKILREKNAARAKAEAEDRKAHAELTKYADLRGREKTIRMLDGKLKDATATVNKYRTILNNLQNGIGTSAEREKSWGIAGGIAEALAGPAAGVAAALDVQNENAEIRQRNEARTKADIAYYHKISTAFYPEIKKHERIMEDATKKLEKAQTMLIREETPEACFARIHFSREEVTISDGGSALVKVFAQTDPFTIFEDTLAVVDGTITAHILHENQEVGQAILVIPECGIASGYKAHKRGVWLSGMALFCCDADKAYTVTFSPRDLWAAEDITV